MRPDVETRSLEALHPEFRSKLEKVRDQLKAKRIALWVGTTVRGPKKQAELYCRSRSDLHISKHVAVLERCAPTMARLLESSPRGLGPQMTNSLPGDSWHQWGMAADVAISTFGGDVLVWGGSICTLLAKAFAKEGLFHSAGHLPINAPGRYFHVQFMEEKSPLLARGFLESWEDVEREMLERFALNGEDFTEI